MDEDLIAYLEKKIKALEADNQRLRESNKVFMDAARVAEIEIKALEAERDHWKANRDNQVKLKNEVAETRFVAMKNQIDGLLLENRRLRLSLSREDPRGDGDVDEAVPDTGVTKTANEDAIRARLLQPFLGSEAEKLGAKSYQLRDGERWLYKCGNRWDDVASVPHWFNNDTYRLTTREQHDEATD